MKILLLNNCYRSGSTGKIVEELENYYNHEGHETVVVYGQGEKSRASHFKIASRFYIKVQALLSRITGLMYGGCFLSTHNAISIIKKEKPDIVHLHCLNSHFVNIYRLITWLKKNKINTVLTNHAEFMYTANCGHALECNKYQSGCGNCERCKKETKSWFIDRTAKSWKKMKCAFEGFETLVVTNVSPWLNERASGSEILKNYKHYIVMNGVNTDVFCYKNNHRSADKKTVLHVTAKFSDCLDDLKGGRFLIELAKELIKEDVEFIVAGKHTLKAELPSNIKLTGNIIDSERLARLYSDANLVVLTSQRETFSMITAESLCCGTPVVGFKAGAPEGIAIPEFSDFVEYGDINGLRNAVEKFLSLSFDKEEISSIARKKYSKEKMAEDYLRIYEKCINRSEY